MSLYSISGIGCEDCGGGCGGGGYIGGKRKAKRTARRAKRKARKTGINCKGARVKSVALAPARNAYLALVRLNVKKLAVKLAKATSTTEGRKKVHAKWCKLGGNGKKLQNAIDKAYAKYKRKRGIIGYMDDQELNQIGVIATATALSLAAPIIAALTPLIKQFAGEKAGRAAEDVEQATRELAPAEENNAEPQYQPQEESGEIGEISINPWIIGAGALAAYYLIKKRK
jgi:hypothetical protein